MEEEFDLKLLAAVAIGGQIKRAGSVVRVGKRNALDLLRRGKAVVATAEDRPADEADEVAGHIAGVVGADGTVTQLADMPEDELKQLASDMGVDTEGKDATALAEAIKAEEVQAVATPATKAPSTAPARKTAGNNRG